MTKVTKSDILKTNLLEALEKSLGVVTTACKSVNCSRKTFYQYMRNDPEFSVSVQDIENIALDYVESQLFKQIKDDNITAIIFYLKTKGRKRGYIERQEIENTNINIIPDLSTENIKRINEILENEY